MLRTESDGANYDRRAVYIGRRKRLYFNASPLKSHLGKDKILDVRTGDGHSPIVQKTGECADARSFDPYQMMSALHRSPPLSVAGFLTRIAYLSEVGNVHSGIALELPKSIPTNRLILS